MNPTLKAGRTIAATATLLLVLSAASPAQDAKFAADALQRSRDFFSKVHLVAIVDLSFDDQTEAEFKYDRYPNGGPERVQCEQGEFARKDGKTWLNSDDWGETGKPADATTTRRLNNWISLVTTRLSGEPASVDPGEGATVLKFLEKKDDGDRELFVFQESKAKPKGDSSSRITFGQYKNDKTGQPLLSEVSGPMRLGSHDATVRIRFSYLIAVNIIDTTDAAETPAPTAEPTKSNAAQPAAAAAGKVSLLDGKLSIDIPPDFTRDPDDPAEPKTLAKFSRADGAWGAVSRGTHGLTPEKLNDYLKGRVTEYTKGFNWLPKDSHLRWLRKEIVTIDGRKWADWRYVPIKKAQKDYRNSPVYTRFLTTSYKGQLLEITFTTNLTTDPELKEEIDHIMDSVHLEQ
ncbi:hypothetical protein BH20VER1_BH20VER1_23970 [soil metagenome]